MERRSCGGNVGIEERDGGGKRIVGHAAVFYDGSRGTEYELWPGTFERVMPGSFDKALGDDVRGLFNHDSNAILGRTKSGTMRINVDAKGLRYEIDVPDTTVGRDVSESIRRGDVTGSSFGFQITDEQWLKVDGKRVREIRGVRLFDAGPVLFPAYEGTSTGVRAEGSIEEARASLAKYEAAEAEIVAAQRQERERKVRILDLAT